MNRKDGKLGRRMAGILGLAALLGAFALLVPGLRADDDTGSAPAARAVRLSYVAGEVHLYQGDQQVGDQAVANTPLFEGARIDTGNDGRAEVQFEDGSVARISPESSLTLAVLKGLSANSERDAEIVLNSGLGYFELQGESDSNHMKVRFGDTQVTASEFSVFRINLDQAPGQVAVFSGNAQIEGGASPLLDLHGGESLALNATDPDHYNLAETIEPDSWDTWNSDRDQEMNTAAADRTEASQDQPDSQNPAWSDLDANGNWYDVPDQGYVWSPNEASNPDWDPYANGYWMDTPGYGYMWISGYPWGYLPYQCGGWNFYPSFGWGWAPAGCNPWWGGNGGWVINIRTAPPRYRYPVRPRPRNPRPMGHDAPRPLIAVNRHGATPGNTMPAPRDKTGTVMIAGSRVQPLRPIQQPGQLNNQPAPVLGIRPTPHPPSVLVNPWPVFRAPDSSPRAIGTPVRPSPVYRAPAPPPRTAPTYTPPQSTVRPVGTPTPRPVAPPHISAPSAPPTPRVSAPPTPHVSAPPAPAPHASAPSGGGRPSSGPHR